MGLAVLGYLIVWALFGGVAYLAAILLHEVVSASAGSLLWMFLLAAIMAVEKNVSWGRRISRPVGVALLAWGTALLIGPQAL